LEHYGSAQDVTEWTTESRSFWVNAEAAPAAGWTVSLGGAVTQSEGEFDRVEVELPEEVVAIADYDFTEIHTYSDLSTTQLEITSRVTRRIREASSVWVEAAWYDLTDDQPWVYGDTDGSVLVTAAGLTHTF